VLLFCVGPFCIIIATMLEYIFPPLFVIGATIFIATVFPQFLGQWFSVMFFVGLAYSLDKILRSK
jgi:hypothetical protein